MGQITRSGAVVLIQSGDAAISGALASGALAAIEARGDAGRLNDEQRQAVEAEIDRQAIRRGMESADVQRALLRVAVNNTKTAEDYAMMRFDAEVAYGEPVDYPTTLERIAEKALAIYGMFVLAASAAFHAQDKILEG